MRKVVFIVLCLFAFYGCDTDGSNGPFGLMGMQVNGLSGANTAKITYKKPGLETVYLSNVTLDWADELNSASTGHYELCADNLSGTGLVEVLIYTDKGAYRKQDSNTACVTLEY